MPARKPPAPPDSPLHALGRLALHIPAAIHHLAAVEAERDAALYQAKALASALEAKEREKPSSPTWTHDVPVGDGNALMERLASCDGTKADCCVLVWKHAQAVVGYVRRLEALRARIEAACGLPDPAEACRVILSLCREEKP